MNELEEYSAKELDRLAREREEAIKAKGGLPYLGSIPVGESSLWLQPKVPTDNPDKDGRPRKNHLLRNHGVAAKHGYDFGMARGSAHSLSPAKRKTLKTSRGPSTSNRHSTGTS